MGGITEDIGIITEASRPLKDDKPSAQLRSDVYTTYLLPPNDSRLGEQFSYIEISVDYLIEISAAIIQSGTRFRHQRADDKLSSREKQLEPLRYFLRKLIEIEFHKMSLSEKPTSRIMDELLTEDFSLDPAQERLVEANLIRRNRFEIYSQDAKQKRSSRPSRSMIEPSPDPVLDAISHVPGSSAKAKSPVHPEGVREKKSNLQTGVPPSSRVATDIGSSLIPPSTNAIKRKRKASGSRVSLVTRTQVYPQCPSDWVEDQDCWCPYCAQLLDLSYVASHGKWKYV